VKKRKYYELPGEKERGPRRSFSCAEEKKKRPHQKYFRGKKGGVKRV